MTAEAPRLARGDAPRTMPGRGNWWVQPVTVAVVFTLFVIYSTWSILFASGGHRWEAGPYLSPFYSPLIKIGAWPLSSAILVAWIPLGFRGTCYYYRKAYYRAFFWDPPACAIQEPSFRRNYRGETKLPWILNNLHRFFLYLALIVVGFLWFDTINAFHYKHGIYVGVGSIVMLVNVVLLTGYTFSCHALRHLVGGSIDCFSCARAGHTRHSLWKWATKINPYHPSFAWFSLFSVAAADIYIRIASSVGTCFGVHTGC
ncbi:MAG: hypothetical protein NVSMB52_11130 [Chloroflexota bacterium]